MEMERWPGKKAPVTLGNGLKAYLYTETGPEGGGGGRGLSENYLNKLFNKM